MSHTFQIIPAKQTFYRNMPHLYASDYIQYKKNKCCNTNVNKLNKKNKYNIISGNYKKLDLTNVCVAIPTNPCNQSNCIACVNANVPINTTNVFYNYNTIDPIGELFGNSYCGINNYIYYNI